MIKYYTRACNFYYGKHAYFLINKKEALPLCGNKNIAFDKLEIYSRTSKNVKSKIISLKQLKNLKKNIQNIIKLDLKKLLQKEKIL